MNSEVKPLFSFGVIADVQYADAEDGWNFHPTAKRRYRHTLTILKDAVQTWKTAQNISFIAQLGDLLDGLNSKTKKSEETVKLLLKEFEDFKVIHVLGNHELYNFIREEFISLLLPHITNGVCYYEFSPHPGWKIVVLDSLEFCCIEPTTRKDAFEYLKLHNPNDCSSYNCNWVKGLHGLERRFLPYNGAMSKNQLDWLTQVLHKASENKEKVIILGHIPICPGSCSDSTLLWNYDEVLPILHSFDCVVAYLAGHDHPGGYIRDKHGIHHRTFESPLEVPVGESAYGVIHVYQDKLVLKGAGMVKDDTWYF